MNSEENQKEIFKKMMEESFKQDELYTAGNYWKYYEKNILINLIKLTNLYLKRNNYEAFNRDCLFLS